jgi:hypothetical protein
MGGWLWSWSMLDCWRKGAEWKEAECKRGHRIPGDNCGCGIWAFFDADTMEATLHPAAPLGRSGRERFEYVGGVIGAGGDIVVHEYGFRAEYAKVLALFDSGAGGAGEDGEGDEPTLATVDEMADAHNCDVIAPYEYDAYCAERGLIRLDEQ